MRMQIEFKWTNKGRIWIQCKNSLTNEGKGKRSLTWNCSLVKHMKRFLCVSVGKGVVMCNSWISTLSGILKSPLNSLVAKSSIIGIETRLCCLKTNPSRVFFFLQNLHIVLTFYKGSHYQQEKEERRKPQKEVSKCTFVQSSRDQTNKRTLYP